MNDRAAFATLVRALTPWERQLVVVGGWAHRLYRLHSMAAVPAYEPLTTLDADIAFAEGEALEGDIKASLAAAGFKEQLRGDHQPPVSHYTLGDESADGFYAEFLTPLTGSGRTRKGKELATIASAGITAQKLRHLDFLLESPWAVTLGPQWGVDDALELRIPNPASFILQKLLIHDERPVDKKAQDILYIHDTLELFAAQLDELGLLWRDHLQPTLHPNSVRSILKSMDDIFGTVTDRIRDAAAIPQDRDLDPERMRAMCHAALGEILNEKIHDS